MQDTKGFFGSLFDLSFTSLVTTRIIKVLYVLAIIVIGLYVLIFIAGGFSRSSSAGIFVLLILAPLFTLISLDRHTGLARGDNRVVSDHGEHQRAGCACKCSGVVKGNLGWAFKRHRAFSSHRPVLVTSLLRPGLLEGSSVLIASTTEPVTPFGVAVGEACTELGAGVHMCAAPDVADEAIVDQMVAAAVSELGKPRPAGR